MLLRHLSPCSYQPSHAAPVETSRRVRRVAAITLLLAGLSSSSAAAPAFADAGTLAAAPPAAVAPALALAPAVPLVVQPTALRIQVPHVAVPYGRPAAVWVRLVSGNAGVPSARVTLQRAVRGSWTSIADLTTGQDGLTHTELVFPSTSNVRAVFGGAAQRLPSASLAAQVPVAPAASPVRVTVGQRAVAEAARLQGLPYVYGAAGPGSFDCSGLTMYVFARLGRSLPHNAAAQVAVTMPVAAGAKQAGDLLFFDNGGGIGHVGIYAGNGMMWHAPHSGDVVRLSPITYFGGYSVGRVN